MVLISIDKQQGAEGQSHQQDQEENEAKNHQLTRRDLKREMLESGEDDVKNNYVKNDWSDFPLSHNRMNYDFEDEQYQAGQVSSMWAWDSHKYCGYYGHKDEHKQTLRQGNCEISDYPSSEESIEVRSPTSGGLEIGTRGSYEKHHWNPNYHSGSQPVGYRSRHPRLFREQPDLVSRRPVHQSDLGRLPRSQLRSERWVRSKEKAQFFPYTAHARREENISTGSQFTGTSNKEVKDHLHRGRLFQESLKMDQDSESESTDVEVENQLVRRPTSPRKSLTIIIPNESAENDGISK